MGLGTGVQLVSLLPHLGQVFVSQHGLEDQGFILTSGIV